MTDYSIIIGAGIVALFLYLLLQPLFDKFVVGVHKKIKKSVGIEYE